MIFKALLLEDAVQRMRGSAHAPITLSIVRRGIAEPFDVKIVRDATSMLIQLKMKLMMTLAISASPHLQ